MKNIILLKPTSFDEQKKHFAKLNGAVDKDKIGLIVVDSITMLYRLEKGSDEEIRVTNKELARQLSQLSEIARKKDIPILVTNQVYADFNKEGNFHMVGGDLLKYWSKDIVKLEFENQYRRAAIVKHRSLPEGKNMTFEISNAGIYPVKLKKKFSLFLIKKPERASIRRENSQIIVFAWLSVNKPIYGLIGLFVLQNCFRNFEDASPQVMVE